MPLFYGSDVHVPGATRTESEAGISWEIVHARRWCCLALSGASLWRACVIDLHRREDDSERIAMITPHMFINAAAALDTATKFAHRRTGVA